MYLKIHESRDGRIIAACDKALVGKILREGKRILDLKKYKNFYIGKETSEKELEEALKNFTSVNLVGEKVVGIAIRMNLAKKGDVLHIAGIPYLHIYNI